jgi:hypothetical protein
LILTSYIFFFYMATTEKENNRIFQPKCLINGFVTILTRWVPLVEQELLILPEHLSSPPVFSRVHVTRSLVLCVWFVDHCLSFAHLSCFLYHHLSMNHWQTVTTSVIGCFSIEEKTIKKNITSYTYVTRSLVLCVWFVDHCLSFCPFYFCLCVFCPSIYKFWLHRNNVCDWMLLHRRKNNQKEYNIIYVHKDIEMNGPCNKGSHILKTTFRLCFLSFYLQILITPLVSSNSSCIPLNHSCHKT